MMARYGDRCQAQSRHRFTGARLASGADGCRPWRMPSHHAPCFMLKRSREALWPSSALVPAPSKWVPKSLCNPVHAPCWISRVSIIMTPSDHHHRRDGNVKNTAQAAWLLSSLAVGACSSDATPPSATSGASNVAAGPVYAMMTQMTTLRERKSTRWTRQALPSERRHARRGVQAGRACVRNESASREKHLRPGFHAG
jgi:hypothetical protein